MAICVARRPSTLLVASTTYQSQRAVSEFTKAVNNTKTPTTGWTRACSAEELGGYLTGGPLEKGAQGYSTPHALAKRRLIIARHGAGTQSGHLYLSGRPCPPGPSGAPGLRPAHAQP